MKPAQLHLVEPVRVEDPVNVNDLVRADIMRRDWSKAMLWADRQRAVFLPDVRRVRRA